MTDYFNGNNGGERKRYGSIRELAEAMRQEAYRQMKEEQEALPLSVAAERVGGRVAGRESANNGEISKATYFPPPFGGNFRNATRNTIVYIVGDYRLKNHGDLSSVKPIKPGDRDAAFMDADFFKLEDRWYKIEGRKLPGTYVVVKDSDKQGKRFDISGAYIKADEKDANACEEMLREYLREMNHYSI